MVLRKRESWGPPKIEASAQACIATRFDCGCFLPQTSQGGSGDALGRLSPMENLSLGMLSGIVSKSINYPLLVNKNLAQQRWAQ